MNLKLLAFGAAALLTATVSPSASAQAFPTIRDHVTSGSQLEDLESPQGAATRQASRSLLPIAVDLVKHFESWQPKAYNDPVGYCTIGYGHLLDKKRCEDLPSDVIPADMSETEGTDLLMADTNTARLAVEDLVKVDLTDEQYGALASFAFNVGKKKFKSSTLLALVNANSELAANEFPRWVKSNGQVLKGLEERRTCEAALFRGSLTYDANGKFNRAKCQLPEGAASEVGPLIDITTGE